MEIAVVKKKHGSGQRRVWPEQLAIFQTRSALLAKRQVSTCSFFNHFYLSNSTSLKLFAIYSPPKFFRTICSNFCLKSFGENGETKKL
jgi:hypothetical protein